MTISEFPLFESSFQKEINRNNTIILFWPVLKLKCLLISLVSPKIKELFLSMCHKGGLDYLVKDHFISVRI